MLFCTIICQFYIHLTERVSFMRQGVFTLSVQLIFSKSKKRFKTGRKYKIQDNDDGHIMVAIANPLSIDVTL